MTETFRNLLRKLASAREPFTNDDIKQAFECIASHAYEAGQIGAFLMALRMTQKDTDPEVVAIAAQVMRAAAIPVDTADEVVADIVGTGGDGQDTFNVSTTAALVAAGAGLKVCKHGNRAASSTSGSADLLLALGCPVDTIGHTSSLLLLRRSNFHFLFAPIYHPALAAIGPIRKALGFPTVFNLLGPLINPAKPRHMVLGVHSASLGRQMCEALRHMNFERAWVVCGRVPGGTSGGLDEISPQGATDVWELHRSSTGDGPSTVSHFVIEPNDFGLKEVSLETVRGGSSMTNAAIVEALFDPLNQARESLEAISTFVVLNAAALLFVAGLADSLPAAAALAQTSIRQGKAQEVLQSYRKASNEVLGR